MGNREKHMQVNKDALTQVFWRVTFIPMREMADFLY